MELDISNSKSIDTFVKNFSEKFSKTGILLNNAGMAYKVLYFYRILFFMNLYFLLGFTI